ncbi:hypothetical protein F5887DRAFT_527929 [Amanita rubescens]|nr:hypothetical protein F5887DRAFT_527929 [Amanita rubescens]
MGIIHVVWETITGDLNIVKENYELWNNPRYFTAASLNAALDDWEGVIAQCEKYISIVAGGNSSVTKEFKAIAQQQPQTKPLQLNAPSPANEELPPPYEVAVLPGHHAILGQEISIKDRVGMFKALAQSDDVNRLIAAFSPAVVVIGVNRSQLTNIANGYQWIANNIRDLYSDSAYEAEILVITINTRLIPSLNTAIEFYIKFAAGEQDPFSGGTSEEAMEAFIRERSAQLNQGTELAASAETVFIKFRSDAQASLNTLTRHLAELNYQLSVKEATLRDLEADYAKWSWVIWWPIPPGVGQIIYLIINSIKRTTEEINKLKNDINKLRQAQSQVSNVQQVSDSLGQMTSTLSQSWSQLTNNTAELSTLVKAVVITPEVAQAILPVVRAKWQALSAELGHW